ncbi:MAG: SLC13 family permease, partial [Verrucomicrobiales bacterium]
STQPFLIGVTLAASLAFACPMGYQTHMMVYGPGGYRFLDFFKIGVPLNLIAWITASLLIPYFWPMHP